MRTLHIDIISDTVCPWCYVGKRQLEQAMARRPDIRFEIDWRPFQLNPGLPPEGMDRIAYLTAKMGSVERVKPIYEQIAAVGRELGIAFNFEGIKQSPNTLRAHCLVLWARPSGSQDAVVEALFKAFFVENRDIGDQDVLVDIASSCGMDGAVVRDLLDRGAGLDRLRQEEGVARGAGVGGVPFFIIEGRYTLSGAQAPESFVQVFDRALAATRDSALSPSVV